MWIAQIQEIIATAPEPTNQIAAASAATGAD
jgi:hypothetical protein